METQAEHERRIQREYEEYCEEMNLMAFREEDQRQDTKEIVGALKDAERLFEAEMVKVDGQAKLKNEDRTDTLNALNRQKDIIVQHRRDLEK